MANAPRGPPSCRPIQYDPAIPTNEYVTDGQPRSQQAATVELEERQERVQHQRPLGVREVLERAITGPHQQQLHRVDTLVHVRTAVAEVQHPQERCEGQQRYDANAFGHDGLSERKGGRPGKGAGSNSQSFAPGRALG
jgi:hypothetical protein